MIGVAVVGCGWAGRRHAEAFVREGADLRWAIDLDQSRAAGVAQLQGATRAGQDLAAALRDDGVRAVSVCLPHHLHLDACVGALSAGRDVLCEKPLATAVEDADRMAAVAEEAGALLMVAENECFHPLNERARQLLEQGVIGKPALVQASREANLRESFLRERPWFLDRDLSGGGILLSGGIHDFAKLRMLLGEVAEIYAVRAPQRFVELETEDTAVVVLRFRNGTVGTLIESFFMLDAVTAGGGEVHRLRIDGERGSLEVVAPDQLRVTTPEETRAIQIPQQDTFRLEVRHFLECVRSRAEPLTSARRQRPNLELVAAAYRSIETGRPLHLDRGRP
jgi:predicted dehydrogenase